MIWYNIRRDPYYNFNYNYTSLNPSMLRRPVAPMIGSADCLENAMPLLRTMCSFPELVYPSAHVKACERRREW